MSELFPCPSLFDAGWRTEHDGRCAAVLVDSEKFEGFEPGVKLLTWQFPFEVQKTVLPERFHGLDFTRDGELSTGRICPDIMLFADFILYCWVPSA